MSSFISSSTQNLFKFATWLNCITHNNMCLQVDIFYNFLHSWCFITIFFLRKNVAWEKKGFWINHITYQVLIRISSNLLQWFIVSYLSIWRWLQTDMYFIIPAFFEEEKGIMCYHSPSVRPSVCPSVRQQFTSISSYTIETRITKLICMIPLCI